MMPPSQQKSRRRVKANLNRLQFERLEMRRLLAAVNDDGSTLNVTLAANETLSVKSNGTSYEFVSNQAITNLGVTAASDFSAFGANTLTLMSAGLSRYSTINITDAATGARVVFVDSAQNQYSDNIRVTLDSGSTLPVDFEGQSRFVTGQTLTVDTQGGINVGAAAYLEASTVVLSAGSGISLGGGVYSSDGKVTLNADADGDGVGTLTLRDHAPNNFVETGLLLDQEPSSFGQLGIGMALSGDGNTLAVVSDQTLVNGQQKFGGLFIYTKSGSTWNLQHKIGYDGNNDDDFRTVSLSQDGNTLLLGNSTHNVTNAAAAGIVYVYTRAGSTWSEQARLFAPVPVATGSFGRSLDLSPDGNTAIISALQHAGVNNSQGAAFVFVRNGSTWTNTQMLIKSNGVAGEYFGRAVAISGDGSTAVITAFSIGTGLGLGSAVVYKLNGLAWQEQQILVSDQVQANDGFGGSVDLSYDGSVIVIGASETRIAGFDAQRGAAYIFKQFSGSWTLSQRLVQPHALVNDRFGGSVSISADGSLLVVSSSTFNVLNSGLQHVYVQRGPTWDYSQRIEKGGRNLLNAQATSLFVGDPLRTVTREFQGAVSTLDSPSDLSAPAGWIEAFGTIELAAADYDLRGNIQSKASVYLRGTQAGRTIDLGTNSAGNIGLLDSELERLIAPSIVIGRDAVGTTLSGPILISAPITLNMFAANELELATRHAAGIAFVSTASIDTRNTNLRLRLDGTGNVQSGTAPQDILAGTGTVRFSLGSGILGQDSNPISIAAAKISTAASGNGDQFLSILNSTSIDTVGLSAGTGNVRLKSGTLNLTANDQIDNNSGLIVDGGTFAIATFNETVSRFEGRNGTLTGTTGTLTVNSQIQLTSFEILTKVQTSHGLRHSGGLSYIFVVVPYSGNTLVESGTLNLLSAATIIPNSQVIDVFAGATLSLSRDLTMTDGQILRGGGRVQGNVIVGTNGRVSPGPDAATLRTRNLTFSGGFLDMQILGTAAGQYDQIDVQGSVNLTPGRLNLTVAPGVVSPGNQFKIINNDGTDLVISPFNSLPEGTVFTVGSGVTSQSFQITYRGGDGNDVVLTAQPQLALAFAPTVISENNGVATATISRTGADTSTALTVSITSNDLTEATVPATVVIPIGATSATFNVTAVDDSLLDGPQTVSISATASGFISTAAELQVLDEETLSLAITPELISEKDGVATATITRSNTDQSSSLLVTLTSSDTSEATVPATVLIPANQASATFTINAVDDSLLDGSVTLSVAGSASGYISNPATLMVSDYETLTLTLSNTSMPELNGTVTGTVTRSNTDIAQPLTVNVATSNPSEASVPVTVTIPAGQSSMTFTITSVDDTLLDGTQTVNISVVALGYSVDSKTLDVLDIEFLGLAIAPSSISELNGSAIATLSRGNSDIALPISVQIQVDDTSEVGVPSSVIIPAGQSSVNFTITAIDDNLVDGVQNVVVTAHHAAYQNASTNLAVTDWEPLSLSLSASSLSERNGTATATISRSTTDTSQPVTINLQSSDTSELVVPATVTIPANQVSISFLVTAIDDTLLDGPQTVLVTGTADGYISASVTATVLDYESLGISVSNSTMSEFGGLLIGTVTRSNTDISQPLTVAIASSDTTEASVPATVTIPAQAVSATFTITAVDDSVLDGPQTITITPTANGYVSQSVSIEVADFEPIRLTIAPSAISERNQTALATLTRTDPTQPVTIVLSSSDTTEATVPATIVLNAGQSSANFLVSAVDDSLLDGAQLITVSASATGYESASQTLTIEDYELLELSLQQSLISEFGGATLATVRRGNSDLAQPLTVSVISSDTSEASVPSSVTIPAGQSSVTFTVQAADDSLLDGRQLVSLTTTATGYVSGTSELRVEDYETLTIALALSSLNENGGRTTATVTRSNIDNALPLTVTVFSSDTSEAIAPTTVEIPSGQDSATFVVTAQDDTLLDGTQPVLIGVTATGYVGSSQSLSVTDHETLTVTIDRAIINEQGGLATGTVRRSNSDSSQALVVGLINSKPGEATLPATVTIPANQSFATFPITAIDDGVDDGAQTLTITANANGYVSLPGSLIVADGIALALSFAVETLSEFGGTSIGTITRANTDLSADLVVTLASSDTSELSVPPSVVIPAGQLSTTFTVHAVDDLLLDGSQSVTVTAVAPSIAPTRSSLTVTDYELLVLSIADSKVSEAGGQTTGRVTRSNTDISQAIVVNLASTDTSEATVPTTVTIPAGQVSAEFVVSAVDDALLDGAQNVTIAVNAPGYFGNQSSIEVMDAETLTLTIATSAISEEGGFASGIVTRSNTDNTMALLVSLTSSDPSEARVPATVIIPGGENSVSFEISAVDDSLLDGMQTVAINASATGYSNALGSLAVTDSESLTLSFNANSVSENGGQIAATVSRSNTDLALPLTVNLSSSKTSKAVVPVSVTIAPGQASATFVVDAIDNATLDGNQLVQITAVATGYASASATLEVTDFEVLLLQLDSTSISEAGGRATMTITRGNTDNLLPQVVMLTNSDSSELSIPSAVTIPAGEPSITVVIDAVDDSLFDGTETVEISINATGYVGTSRTLDVTDVETLQLLTVVDSMSEQGGTIAFTLARSNTDVQSELIVQLVSSDPSEAQTPGTVVIPAGQSSVTFAVTAADDSLLDGLQTVRVDATAAGYFGFTKSILVTDSEQLNISLREAVISEQNGFTTATVSRSNTDIEQALTVVITNTDESEVQFPATIIIPAGQSSTSFAVNAVDDSLLDGTQSAVITVAAAGYTASQFRLSIADHEALTISLSTANVPESGGSLTGLVLRSNSDLDQALTISLNSSDTTEIRVPAQIVIPSGQQSASFVLEVMDDTLLDGAQTVALTATANGYLSTPSLLTVLDAETLAIDLDTSSIAENGGTILAIVSRSNKDDLSAPLVVTLSSSDTNEVSVPGTVIIPANQSQTSFSLTAVDDLLLDGTKSVSISASGLGYGSDLRTISVLDAEELSIQLSQLSMREAGSVISGIVSRSNTDTSAPLIVTLSSSDESEAKVPSSVTIPAGQSSITFSVTAQDDSLLDGTQRVIIVASASGYSAGEVKLDVTDAEAILLSIDMPSVAEAGSPTIATVTRSNIDIDGPLLVLLTASDERQLELPSSIIIPAGQRSASFTLRAIDDLLLDGTQIVTIEAKAEAYEPDSMALSVIDHEILSLSFNINSIAEKNGVALGTVTRRNTDNELPLTVQLTNSSPAQANIPSSVIILAGQSSATFTLSAINDVLVDGTQKLLIGASAIGYSAAEVELEITDDDRLFPWNNPRNRLDVNDDGFITPLDALLVINALNSRFQLPATLPEPFDPVRYLDVDPNGMVTPLDALLVINHLNRRSAGEGESAQFSVPSDADLIELLASERRRKRFGAA